MDPRLTISVIIVNWNSRNDLRECLEALSRQTDRDFQTIVVENGSEDGSAELVREHFPFVTLVDTGENLGFAEGCNRGLAHATGEWIALLNNDSVAEPDWIAELRAAARDASPTLGMLQSRVMFKRKPDRTNSTGMVLFRDGRASDRDFDAPVRADDRLEEVFCTTAGAGCYRRSMLDEVRLPSGVLDRNFFMYFEDLDLGWRCRLAGYEAVYVPTAIVHHRYQASSRRRDHHFVERQCKQNRIRALLKNGSVPFLVRTLPRTVVDVGRLLSWDGPRALLDVARAVHDSLEQRAEVARLARHDRRAIERRWVKPAP